MSDSKHPSCQAFFEDFSSDDRAIPCNICAALGVQSLGGVHPRKQGNSNR